VVVLATRKQDRNSDAKTRAKPVSVISNVPSCDERIVDGYRAKRTKCVAESSPFQHTASDSSI
jgi:hypothetical protein